MKKILLEISYLGSDFCGYQVQPDKRTVQSQLNNAAKALFGFDCDIVGCSRTDSGVHANQFFATLTQKGTDYIETDIPAEKIPLALSFHLPSDIAVKNARWVDADFHPRYSVKSKEYLYRLYCDSVRNPFDEGRAWHYTRRIDDEAFEKMQIAAKSFIGTHDFAAFMASNSSVSNTVRTIYSLEIERCGNMISVRVCGDGFLYNMVRIIVGTLISVAEGKIAHTEIESIIESKNRARAGITAPPQGLYLNKVLY